MQFFSKNWVWHLVNTSFADPDANDDDGDSPRAWVSEDGIPAMLELFGEYERRGLS